MNPTNLHTLQTRIPAFLWDALQDTFYEQDVAFLRQIGLHIQVPLGELKRTILGVRGAMTTIHVGNTDAWWETQLCPLRHRDGAGIWRQCPRYREGGGFCHVHRDFWEGTADLKHKEDPWFQHVPLRTPWRYEGEIVWVSEGGDVIREDGSTIEGLRIRGGVVFHDADLESA